VAGAHIRNDKDEKHYTLRVIPLSERHLAIQTQYKCQIQNDPRFQGPTCK